MEYFCQLPFPLIPENPFPFSPTIPILQDLQQLKLRIFAFFILFNWIFQLHSPIFPLLWALLLEGNPCSTQEFPNSHLRAGILVALATTHC